MSAPVVCCDLLIAPTVPSFLCQRQCGLALAQRLEVRRSKHGAGARFSDAGGLYIEISPAGSKRWFLKHRIAGVEKQLALGRYPDVTLTTARKARDAAKLKKSDGLDPLALRKIEKLKAIRTGDDTFKTVVLEWFGKQAPQWSASHAERSLRQLECDLFPWIGARPMNDTYPMELLAALQKVEERGAVETAVRVLMPAQQVWDYWLRTTNNAQRP